MSDTDLVPEHILLQEANILQVYLALSHGTQMLQAIEDAGLAKTTFNRWRREHPEYFSAIAKTASVLTLEQRKMEAALLGSYRSDVALKVQMSLLDAAPQVVRRQIQIAVEDSKPADATRAAQLVQVWTAKGYVREKTATPEELTEERSSLPFDPVKQITPASISLPEGTKVTIVTPDIVDAS